AINNTIKAMPGHVWYVLASIVLLVDQSSKSAVVYAFAFGEQIRVTSFFNLVHIKNDGAAFSLLANAGGWQRYVFILLALGASIWMVQKLR
ncbi:signal peptidase II, partial [Acinetobacter baumannii]